MAAEQPHPDALEDFDKAYIPERKIRAYALRNPSKRRPFEALGFSEGAGNWEVLRDVILSELPRYPAVFDNQGQHGITYEVVLSVTGPNGKEAPVKTYWIRRWEENFPQLTTLYINTREWGRWEQEKEDTTDEEA
jgi:hypothetical protein